MQQQNMFNPPNPYATGANFNSGAPIIGANLIDQEAVNVMQPSAKKKKKKKRAILE